MTLIVEINRPVKPIGKIHPISIEKKSNVQRPFLQMLPRKERGEHRFYLLVDRCVTVHLGPMKFAAKCVEVINDLLAAFGKVFRQRCIDLRKLLVKAIQFRVDLFFDIIEHLCRILIQILLYYSRQQFFRSDEKIF